MWTAKEAAAKVRREGLRLDVRRAVVAPAGAGATDGTWRALRVQWVDGRSRRPWDGGGQGSRWVMTIAGDLAATRWRPASARPRWTMNDFMLVYEGFDSGEEGLRETLTSTGNGYFCTRGTAEWEDASAIHYPGTYAHGVYDRETTIMGGHPVLNEDLVNLPNWLVLKLRIDGEEILRLENLEVLSYRHALDVRNALVIRELRFRDRTGRQTRLESRRFVEHEPHAPGGARLAPHGRELVGQRSRSSRRSTGGCSTRASPATGSSRGVTSIRRARGSPVRTSSR